MAFLDGLDDGFRRAGAPAVPCDGLSQFRLPGGAVQGEDRPDLPGRDRPVGEELPRLRRQLEHAQQVRHGGAAAADFRGGLGLGVPHGLHQVLDGLGLLQGIQVPALDIFHQGQFLHLLFRIVPHQDRHGLQLRQPGRPQAPLAGDEFIVQALPADDQGLDNAVFPDGVRQFGQFVLVKGLAGLPGVRLDAADFHFQGRLVGAAVFRQRLFILGLARRQEGTQPAAQSVALTHRRSPPWPAPCIPRPRGSGDHRR